MRLLLHIDTWVIATLRPYLSLDHVLMSILLATRLWLPPHSVKWKWAASHVNRVDRKLERIPSTSSTVLLDVLMPLTKGTSADVERCCSLDVKGVMRLSV